MAAVRRDRRKDDNVREGVGRLLEKESELEEVDRPDQLVVEAGDLERSDVALVGPKAVCKDGARQAVSRPGR